MAARSTAALSAVRSSRTRAEPQEGPISALVCPCTSRNVDAITRSQVLPHRPRDPSILFGISRLFHGACSAFPEEDDGRPRGETRMVEPIDNLVGRVETV